MDRRTDLAPLEERFPAIGKAVSAVWYSGSMSGSDAPGPSTYWIDAVIELDTQTAANLRATSGLSVSSVAPDVVDELVQSFPAGDLLSGLNLNSKFSDGRTVSKVYISTTTPALVISSKMQ